MDNFKFNFLSRGQRESLSLDKFLLTGSKTITCHEIFFPLYYCSNVVQKSSQYSCAISFLTAIEHLLAIGQSFLNLHFLFCNVATIYGHANKQMLTHCTVLHYWTIPELIALPSSRPPLSCSAVQLCAVHCTVLHYVLLYLLALN